jgi:hypothetical protein
LLLLLLLLLRWRRRRLLLLLLLKFATPCNQFCPTTINLDVKKAQSEFFHLLKLSAGRSKLLAVWWNQGHTLLKNRALRALVAGSFSDVCFFLLVKRRGSCSVSAM